MSHKRGDLREDGYRFKQYKADGRELWLSPPAWHKHCLGVTLRNARDRAKAFGLPCDLDLAYLQSIFPKDAVCPVLGLPLTWGREGGMYTSPSLDRIAPALGYIKGNVAFISGRANTLKSNATVDELQRLASYMKATTAVCHPN